MERLILLPTFVAVLVALIGGDASLHAETNTLDLPADYADYALDPETGNILALNAEASRVELYRGIDIQSKQVSPAQVTSVGMTPCSVCYKRFGDLKTFAVVCSQDTAMYLIDPDTGELSSKIVLSQLGVTDVTCSANPEDPFCISAAEVAPILKPVLSICVPCKFIRMLSRIRWIAQSPRMAESHTFVVRVGPQDSNLSGG